MTRRAACAAVALLAAVAAAAAGFGMPGGPPPQNLEEVAALLRKDAYDLELLISYGTSKGGSAGHLALAIRDAAPGDDLVHSANFYADRAPEHSKDRYTEDLMVAIPKQEYLFGTTSTLGPKASFGLDFGEVYKRSVIGVRVYGVPAREKDALAAFFRRLNADFHARARNTAYHDGEVRYDYLRLNCAKTIGSAFRVGAGYRDLEVEGTALLPGRTRMVAASNANIPTEMAMKLLKAWDARGYGLDVVLYRKYDGSPYVDPLEEEKVAFRDLPNRFPSVLSRDFAKEAGQYQDYDNLFAMYLLHNLRRYEVRVNGAAGRLEVERRGEPMPYRDAVVAAKADAQADRDGFGRRQPFRKRGTPIGEAADGSQPAGRSGPGQPPRRAATALSDATAR